MAETSMAFVMDTRVCDGAYELAEDVDLLVIESTYLSSEEREAGAHGHLTARQAARIAKESGAKRVVLTHFSQRYGSLKPFLAEARELSEACLPVFRELGDQERIRATLHNLVRDAPEVVQRRARRRRPRRGVPDAGRGPAHRLRAS